MSRKYVPPTKKRKASQATHAPAKVPGGVSLPVAAETSVVYPVAAKTGTVPEAMDTVKYESLPRELRRMALLTALTMVIMVVLWLILR